ncbi:MAG: methyl-accepting chemotaxis protein [Oscillibacter sp.]|jgi:methyl-accepting chemotaxis protein|uniref:methyl-accepting chemotaxis protein n=1 Tax=uncultured Oscillibacter sp. TaxID=876091 RepID=UPI00216DBA90|nr:methyl-accepting chemotaxis protein [uncultured Oscillibacter sp.]MCI9643984.1 methyl-accepting chemotaxis protein [Oscillibacter sp.]
MIKNMKVRKSLVMGYGITIAVSVIIIIISLVLMSVQKGQYTDILDKYVESNMKVSECRISYNIAARNLRDAVLSGDMSNIDNANSKISELKEELTQLSGIYPLDDKTELNNFIKLVENWEAEAENIGQTARTDQSQAATMIVNNCSPVLAQAASAGDSLAQKLQAAQADIISQQNMVSTIAIIAIIVAMVIATLVVIRIALLIIKSIVIPTEKVRAALVGFSEGKLDIPVDYESKSELGEMCDALRSSQHTLVGVIQDTCRLLEEMGNGNFNCRTEVEELYVGELSSMLKSIRIINRSLSDTLAQISLSGEQVSSGSDQVSTGAQALAQGATEQASAVQELSATIAEISTRSQSNAKRSEEAIDHSKNADLRVRESADYMEEMVKAMEKISGSSQEIGKIIATIENIAFQTNILALNAAVEAARAGSAGKGFAVVADEVRNLATKSDQAAKATKELIDNSITAVQDGSEIVKRVSESLDKTVQATNESMSALQEIAKAVEEEASAIAQVTEGIDQISSVVQTNSATSEQSAAASEELSSQASLMKDLLSKFHLRSDSGSGTSSSYSSYSAPAYSEDSSEDLSYDSGYSAGGSAFSKY